MTLTADCGTRSSTFANSIFTVRGCGPRSGPPGSGSDSTPLNEQPDRAVTPASAAAPSKRAPPIVLPIDRLLIDRLLIGHLQAAAP
ncbi:hypothetical protein ACFQY7_34505 [Actinomadura luteofluorescens]|uniref:hypothetical protein n=1 Tax=Actinomadura luteofluorescens TaxID=46163 RepID=UPI00363050C1